MFETVINPNRGVKGDPETIAQLIAKGCCAHFPCVSTPGPCRSGPHRHASTYPHSGRVKGARTISRDGTLAPRSSLIRTVPGPPAPKRAGSAAITSRHPYRAHRALPGDGRRLQNATGFALAPSRSRQPSRARRYDLSIRYPRDYRSDPQAIATRGADPVSPRRHGAAGQSPRLASRKGRH